MYELGYEGFERGCCGDEGVGGPRPLAAPFPLTPGSSPGQALALSHIGERERCDALSRGLHPPACLASLARVPLRCAKGELVPYFGTGF